MKTQYSARLSWLLAQKQQHLLVGGLKGIEKESLRLAKSGMISHLAHPHALGSALTHPLITTDYSESLLEFITQPFTEITEMLDFMYVIHQYVVDNIDDELLLATSMPCGINGDASIPIANYGNSNIGKMKHIYRKGLWYRYGKSMQAISGIHFNYSIPEALWPILLKQSSSTKNLADFISEAYFGLIRNFQRQGWLILYLFGASPVICKSFLKNSPHSMPEFDSSTLYYPYATSLRMSDIGYKSKNQENLKIDYNSLTSYTNSLTNAVETCSSFYQKIGVKVNGKYKQLNANILQIENEYYSTIRPKQIVRFGEKPTLALNLRGIRYIEVRSLDIDPFNPIGIDENKARFMEAFLINCLLQDSPKYIDKEAQTNNNNQLIVAQQGRKPELKISKNGRLKSLQTWACEILQSMSSVCKILDNGDTKQPYSNALNQQFEVLENPELTPSAKILASMGKQNQSFNQFGLNISALHKKYFMNNKLDKITNQKFAQMSATSHKKQKEIESNDQLSFDDFLSDYFAQSSTLGRPRTKLRQKSASDNTTNTG